MLHISARRTDTTVSATTTTNHHNKNTASDENETHQESMCTDGEPNTTNEENETHRESVHTENETHRESVHTENETDGRNTRDGTATMPESTMAKEADIKPNRPAVWCTTDETGTYGYALSATKATDAMTEHTTDTAMTRSVVQCGCEEVEPAVKVIGKVKTPKGNLTETHITLDSAAEWGALVSASAARTYGDTTHTSTAVAPRMVAANGQVMQVTGTVTLSVDLHEKAPLLHVVAWVVPHLPTNNGVLLGTPALKKMRITTSWTAAGRPTASTTWDGAEWSLRGVNTEMGADDQGPPMAAPVQHGATAQTDKPGQTDDTEAAPPDSPIECENKAERDELRRELEEKITHSDLHEEAQQTLLDRVAEFVDVFQPLGAKPMTAPAAVLHTVPPHVKTYKRTRSFQQFMSPAAVAYGDKYIANLKALGIVEDAAQAENPIGCVAPTLVIQQGSKFRIVHDYGDVNDILYDEPMQVMTVAQIFRKLGRVGIMSVFDQTSGFLQVPLDPCSKYLTSFEYRGRIMVYTRLPMGLKTAPGIYCRAVQAAFNGLTETHTVMDDTTIASAPGPRDKAYALPSPADDLRPDPDDDVFGGLPCSAATTERAHRDEEEWRDKVAAAGEEGVKNMHLRHVDSVTAFLSRCRARNIKLSMRKVQLGKRDVKLLGMAVDTFGPQHLPERLGVIESLPRPTTVKQMFSWLGRFDTLFNYRPDLALLAAPLRPMVAAPYTMRRRLAWTPEQNKAFEECKAAVGNLARLRHPVLGAPFRVLTDASERGVGAVLQQQGRLAPSAPLQWLPIRFFSRKFTESEGQRNTEERETLAIVWAAQAFSYIFFGSPCTILTDNSNVSVRRANRRAARLLAVLQEHGATLEHCDQATIQWADAISRAPLEAPEDKSMASDMNTMMDEFPTAEAAAPTAQTTRTMTIEKDKVDDGENQTDTHVMAVHTSEQAAEPTRGHSWSPEATPLSAAARRLIEVTPTQLRRLEAVPLRRLVLGQRADVFASTVLLFLRLHDHPDRADDLTTLDLAAVARLEPRYRKRDRFRVRRDGALVEVSDEASLFGTVLERTVLPRNMLPSTLLSTHSDNHLGAKRMLSLLQHRYFMPRLAAAVHAWTRSCDECQKAKRGKSGKGPMTPLEHDPSMPLQIMQRVHVDLTGPVTVRGEKYLILAATEALSRYTWARVIPSKEAHITADHFEQMVINAEGVPGTVVLDQGGEWNGDNWESLRKRHNFEMRHTSRHSSQSNGVQERRFRVLKENMTAVLLGERNATRERLDVQLGRLLLIYNASSPSAPEFAPFWIMRGRHCRVPGDAQWLPLFSKDGHKLAASDYEYDIPYLDSSKKHAMAVRPLLHHQRLDKMRQVYEMVRAMRLDAADDAARKAAIDLHWLQLKQGDLVLSLVRPHKDLRPHWDGPYRVLEALPGGLTYRLGSIKGVTYFVPDKTNHLGRVEATRRKRDFTEHVRYLKRYYARDDGGIVNDTVHETAR